MPRPDIIPLRGAIAEPLVMEVLRPLTQDDLGQLASAPAVGTPILKRLRATHHRQAALLAEGRSVSQVAAIVGCTPQRLVQLQNDPAFTELVHYYHDQMMVMHLTDAARLKDKIIDVGEMAVDELRERLEDDERRKRISAGEIRKIAEFAMDRTVAPPQMAPNTVPAPTAVTINFGTPIDRRPDDDARPARVIDSSLDDDSTSADSGSA